MPSDVDAPATDGVKIRDGGCKGCTLCCKVLAVASLHKAANTWCPHCNVGAELGCGIYGTRPGECSNFICGFLSIPELPEEWRPATSRLIIFNQNTDGNISVFVDPSRPDAWRKQPYYKSMQAWAARALPARRRVVVRIGNRSIVILPDHAIDLGPLASNELIVVLSRTALDRKESRYQVYAVPEEVWARDGFQVSQGTRAPLASEGYRAGRRLD